MRIKEKKIAACPGRNTSLFHLPRPNPQVIPAKTLTLQQDCFQGAQSQNSERYGDAKVTPADVGLLHYAPKFASVHLACLH